MRNMSSWNELNQLNQLTHATCSIKTVIIRFTQLNCGW